MNANRQENTARPIYQRDTWRLQSLKITNITLIRIYVPQKRQLIYK